MDGMLTRTMYENGKDERWRLIADRPEQSSVVKTGWNGAELNDMGSESGCRVRIARCNGPGMGMTAAASRWCISRVGPTRASMVVSMVQSRRSRAKNALDSLAGVDGMTQRRGAGWFWDGGWIVHGEYGRIYTCDFRSG